MPTFRELRTESIGRGERNDCSVIALSVVTGVDYSTAHRAMTGTGRKPRGYARCGATERAARTLGRSTVQHYGWDYSRAAVDFKQLPAGHPMRKAKTMISAERVLQKCYPGRRFLIGVQGHIAGFDGHTLQDWSRGRRHRVTSIVEVI